MVPTNRHGWRCIEGKPVPKSVMNMEMENFADQMKSDAKAVETLLERLLLPGPLPGEKQRPARLLAAMRHGVLNGGKRIRPALVMESAALSGGDPRAAVRVAAALECIHCYSLIHDDLPCMDDDDMRRGLPTVHKAYDEATAILAGDALLTLAFDIVASPETPVHAKTKLDLVVALARAAGIGGMAGGQALDLEAEGAILDEAGITLLQSMKTGALIRFACEAGAMIGGAPPEDRQSLSRFGEIIGLAFQLRDDMLDVMADPEILGKATSKDAGRGKATLVSLNGMDWAATRLDQLAKEARALLAPYGADASMLVGMADYVTSREN